MDKTWYTLGGLSLTIAVIGLTQGAATNWYVVAIFAVLGWLLCVAGSVAAEARNPVVQHRDPTHRSD